MCLYCTILKHLRNLCIYLQILLPKKCIYKIRVPQKKTLKHDDVLWRTSIVCTPSREVASLGWHLTLIKERTKGCRTLHSLAMEMRVGGGVGCLSFCKKTVEVFSWCRYLGLVTRAFYKTRSILVERIWKSERFRINLLNGII